MKESVRIEDTPEGVFIAFQSTGRRIAKIVDSNSVSVDAVLVRDGINFVLKMAVFKADLSAWLNRFVYKYGPQRDLPDFPVDNYTRETAAILSNRVNNEL